MLLLLLSMLLVLLNFLSLLGGGIKWYDFLGLGLCFGLGLSLCFGLGLSLCFGLGLSRL